MKIIDWDNIDTILFDLDGTLIDLHLDAYFWKQLVPQTYADKEGLDAQTCHARIQQLYRDIEHSMQWYDIDHWAKTLDLPIREMQRQHALNTQVRSGVYPLLESLQKLDKQLILLTDSHPFSLQVKMDNCNLSSYFEQLLSSHQFQRPKMHSALWQSVYQHCQLNPDRTLLIDDMEPVLDQAKSNQMAYTLGITTPDSQQPPKQFNNHPSITDFQTLLGSLSG
ncbi:GMP/IMP nucleotidase [Testudinibacter aquarius]|uniref:Putative hydrolase of the HAD superfamily n=1 Tax=Testudinibacter aquarius TaxID=1524974 RepID=A0A4R3Y3E9_9PAST|nr:GMP/IMP nucleotidase [Testudinibacter aquarius]KAE9527815.1 hypothetical protein A1D24_10675 [Testudinibacter aquarius]TCV84864.1 putative hydrolase of the HAD superfamily [Testudinibacter aquarius]